MEKTFLVKGAQISYHSFLVFHEPPYLPQISLSHNYKRFEEKNVSFIKCDFIHISNYMKKTQLRLTNVFYSQFKLFLEKNTVSYTSFKKMYTLKIVSEMKKYPYQMKNICLPDFLPINQFNGPNIIMENYLMGMVDIKFFYIF